MVFISRLKLRNFKSFKAADIQLPKTFICFAGPNGSGKSNLCDAIRFAMGETSLRSLRAKKVRDLINSGSKSAEVVLVFGSDNDGHGYEIKRAIRDDGKIRYRLNGKRTTRSAILEALKRHNLDESGRNTIAQGEVQRIISMNGKERRAIIDSVAGIADFEEKKKEALRELQTVEERIKEARVILGERRAYLDELGREKEVALKYTEAKKMLTNAKGTLLRTEIGKLEKDLAEAVKGEEKLLSSRAAIERELAAIDAEISQVDALRAQTSSEMQAKQKTNALIRRLEELKASAASRKQFIEDREGALLAMKGEREGLQDEIAREREAIEAIEKESVSLRTALADAEKELAAAGGFSEDQTLTAMRKAVEAHDAGLSSAREKLIFIESETSAKKQLIESKREEEGSILPKDLQEEAAVEDVNALRMEAERLGRELDGSFSRIKEINARMNELDRQMLELKEKASIFKVRTSPHLANPALSFIAEMIKDRGSGIYGTVADLIAFDAEHAAAVEAAGGSRLLYVVVDSVDTATATIEKLKKARAGRATFIPLDSIRTPAPAKNGRFSSVREVISCKEDVRRAVEYVFADTLLVDTVSDAKKLGVGTHRMVTLDGEIFERSGIVSGGRGQSSMLSAHMLRKIEDELAGVKDTKDAFMSELSAIREGESRIRGERSKLEVRIKTLEMQERLAQERRKESEHLFRRREQIASDIKSLEESVAQRQKEREELAAAILKLEKDGASLRKRLEEAEGAFMKQTEASSKKREELSAKVSSLKASIDGRRNELALRKNQCSAREERRGRLAEDERETRAKISETSRLMKDEERELTALEEKISSASKEIEKLFEQMKGFEGHLQTLGGKRGHARLELERLQKDMNQFTVRKATATTRLEDLKAEFASYEGAEQIDAGREELSRMVGEAERTLATLGNVNMAAIEMFDRKKAEIEEVEGKMGQLDTEREAILAMIGEIEEHKKDAFFETFQAVSQNFANMFKHINVGQGHLYLNDPANPFESGLFIKLRRNNQEHSLDALSGGEKTLVALMFIFALQLFKPAPFYILDEVDAALDKPNSKNLADLVARMSGDSQFVMVTHNDTVMSHAESVIGVTKADGASKLVGIKLKQAMAQT
ncbi:MAG: chromosome segregation SMC family protein [Candidatus Micrarchaeota archaeon]